MASGAPTAAADLRGARARDRRGAAAGGEARAQHSPLEVVRDARAVRSPRCDPSAAAGCVRRRRRAYERGRHARCDRRRRARRYGCVGHRLRLQPRLRRRQRRLRRRQRRLRRRRARDGHGRRRRRRVRVRRARHGERRRSRRGGGGGGQPRRHRGGRRRRRRRRPLRRRRRQRRRRRRRAARHRLSWLASWTLSKYGWRSSASASARRAGSIRSNDLRQSTPTRPSHWPYRRSSAPVGRDMSGNLMPLNRGLA